MTGRTPRHSSTPDDLHPSQPGPASKSPAARPAPGLYVTATPIGNMGDITLRALDTLRQSDVIACEDTRVTGRLLARYGIDRPMLAYHEHNAARMRPEILRRLQGGAVVALVSDAGTPLISDPGYKLVGAALAEGLAVHPLPGASSLLAALCVAGLPTDRFLFAGFLPGKPAARRRELEGLARIDASIVLLESARRLAETLRDLAAIFGSRPAAVARELTKLHEEVRRGELGALAEHYRAAGPPKGEVVLVIGPPSDTTAAGPQMDDADLDRMLAAALERSGSLKQAVAEVTAESGRPRRLIYARALALKDPAGG